MIGSQHLKAMQTKLAKLEAQLISITNGEKLAKLAKEHAELKPVVELATEIDDIVKQIKESNDFVAGDDQEMARMANEELQILKPLLEEKQKQLKIMLLPKDKADNSSIILEVRAGTGGDEAAIFAGDLFRMYQRYAQLNGWKFEILSSSISDMGGYKEAQANIKGNKVFATMKFEAGVHRVQRVPQTETQGRVHTSAATVAVLPEPEDVDIVINDQDLRVDVFRASGPGGQSVNTTDSAVRITHLPTGLVVSQQDEKSQHKNKAKAMIILRARLYENERAKQDAIRAKDRKQQVGSGDRSDRIRTYNYPQGRVTDHRINLTLYKLEKVILGDALHEFSEELIADDQTQRMAQLENNL